MQIGILLQFILLILHLGSSEDSLLEAVNDATKEKVSADQKRESDQIVVIDGAPDPPDDTGLLLLDDPPPFDTQAVAVEGSMRLVSDDDDDDDESAPTLMVGVGAGNPSPRRMLPGPSRPLLEPLQLPPVVDVYPEVPDRVGDTPLQVQTVIESDPTPDDQPVDVPWVWDDKLCTPLLNRPPPPAGPLTADQVTFALPLVIREGKRLKLKTLSGAVAPIYSDEAASVFERLFWCITALIARVREPEERSRLMRKLYQDYLLWMDEDVIPIVNQTDLKKAYKWIKKKDDSQWVVPEKQYYSSALRSDRKGYQKAEGGSGSGNSNNTLLIIMILLFVVLVLLILYCCLVKKRKIFNFWCFCVCERCKRNKKGNRYQEDERRPLNNQGGCVCSCAGGGTGGGGCTCKGGMGGARGPGEPTKSYVYRSSSWSSNSSLQPPCDGGQNRSGRSAVP